MAPLSTCGEGPGVRDLLSDDEIEKLITSLLKSIFKNQSISSLPDALKKMFVDQLWKSIVSGYGTDIGDVDFDTPDFEMLEALKNDVIRFSSAKDDTMNRALQNELFDEQNNIRSWTDFRNAAHSITNDHVHSWLKAERNLAIVSAQAASKWVAIERNREDLPLLQFDAVMDESTTEICRNFNGVTLPIDDKFWDQYYIPNHYGERSTIRQLDEGELTDTSKIVYPEKIPTMFKVNLAKMKKAFPPDHPYYKR